MNRQPQLNGRRFARTLMLMTAFLLTCITPSARAAEELRFALDNGLEVILRPVDGADEAALLVCFDFGENADPKGKSGLSHFIEHLYLTAAAGQTPIRTVDEIVAKYQGLFNAQTGEDYTVIATVFPAGELHAELSDAAARMATLRITQTDVDRERPRILLELNNMYGGISGLGALNRAREALRPSPEGARKGGAIEVIESLTLDELTDAAKRWYKPINAHLVVTGAFHVEKTQAKIEELFAAIPPGEKAALLPREYAAHPPTVVVQGTEPNAPGVVVLAYPCPPAGREHAAAGAILVPRIIAQAQASGDAAGRFPPPVFHPVLDDPYLLYVGTLLRENETAEAAIARLDARVATALTGAVQMNERMSVRNGSGMFLGFVDPPQGLPAQGLYGLAFSLARRAQLSIDPQDVAKRLESIDEAGLTAAGEAVFNPARRSAVVIMPMTQPKPDTEPAADEKPSNGPGGS